MLIDFSEGCREVYMTWCEAFCQQQEALNSFWERHPKFVHKKDGKNKLFSR